MVWKPLTTLAVMLASASLRENHSGMETLYLAACWPPEMTRLRENHSGMETEFAKRGKGIHFQLRENHSGMETWSFSTDSTTCCECVA